MDPPKNLAKIKKPYFNILVAAKSHTPRTYQRVMTNQMTALDIREEARQRRNSAARKIRIAELQAEIAGRATMEELDAALDSRNNDYGGTAETERLMAELQGLLTELHQLQKLENPPAPAPPSMCAVQRRSRKTKKSRKSKKSRKTRK